MENVAKHGTVEQKVKNSCALGHHCEERQWVWPPGMRAHGVAQWISLASLSTLVFYVDSVFSGCSRIASGSNTLFLTLL